MSNENENTPSNEEKNIPTPTMIFRAGWKALPPKWQKFLTLPVSKVVYVSTKTKECHTEQECEAAVGEIQRLDMIVNGYPDIQYNFLVGGDFRVYEGRGWRVQPSMEPKFEYLEGDTIKIAYIGDYDEVNPTKPMALAGFFALQNAHNDNLVADEIEFIPIRNGEECRRFKLDVMKGIDTTSSNN